MSGTTSTMRAFVISEENVEDSETGKTKRVVGRLSATEQIPVPAEGEALVRVLRAGVCNTDLELLAGYMGFAGIVGHEFVGVVEHVNCHDGETEAGISGLVGKRVVGEINLACAACHVCEGGGDLARNHCPNRTVLGILGKHGTYAEFLTLPCRNLHVVPDNVTDAAALFAEPLAAACRILEQGLAPPEARAAVLGDGKLGLLIAEVLARRAASTVFSSKTKHLTDTVTPSSSPSLSLPLPPAPPPTNDKTVAADGNSGGSAGSDERSRPGSTTIIGRHREKMVLCCAGLGDAEGRGELTRVDAGDESAVTAMAGAFDVVVDATGSPLGLASACALCRPMGTVVLKSTCAAGAGFNPAPIVINEQRVVGSRCGPFEAALELLASSSDDVIDVEQYISEVFPLGEAGAALEAAKKKGALKVQIICSGEGSK